MSTVIEKLAEQQDKALELWSGLQKPVIDGVRRTRTVIGERAATLPLAERFPKLTLPAELPDAREVLRAQFSFAEKVLASNKQFALGLVDAVSPLPAKIAPKVAPTVSAARATAAKVTATASAAPKRARAKRATAPVVEAPAGK